MFPCLHVHVHQDMKVREDMLGAWMMTIQHIFQWIKIEAQDRALGAGSQEICQWMVRSWSLGDRPIKKNNTRIGAKKKI